jgi:alpha-mannosidase
MAIERTTVFLPCHTLDDFPTWLEEAEADDLLAAWTAAWHPALVAAVGAAPQWASIDLPVPQGPLLGIVPTTWDDRFAAQFDSACTVGSAFVRRAVGVEQIERAAADRLGLPVGPLAGARWADDFRAVGVAALLAGLLARRMRTHADLESTSFFTAVVAAARAVVAGRDDDAEAALREAFDAVSATRARYYPVDSYVIDLVLVAAATRGAALVVAIDSPVPVAVAASGESITEVFSAHPDAVAAVRAAVEAGRVELCSGPAADTPLDLATPESALHSFIRGRRRPGRCRRPRRRRRSGAPRSVRRGFRHACPLLPGRFLRD